VVNFAGSVVRTRRPTFQFQLNHRLWLKGRRWFCVVFFALDRATLRTRTSSHRSLCISV